MPDGILYVRRPRFCKNCRATEEEEEEEEEEEVWGNWSTREQEPKSKHKTSPVLKHQALQKA
jgi:hypothetical protein